MLWTAIIPVRNGSKGLKNKNTRLLHNKPLYAHTVDQALRAGASKVIISTDIPEILNQTHSKKVIVVKRPRKLTLDKTNINEVLSNLIKTASLKGILVLLQATSPLRKTEDIKKALRLFSKNEYRMVLTVSRVESIPLKFGMLDGNIFSPVNKPEYCFENRQNLPNLYRPNGSVYIFSVDEFCNQESLPISNLGAIEIPYERSIDIDNISDFLYCEKRLNLKKDGN